MERKIVSGVMLTLLTIGMLTLAFNIHPVKSDWTWTETIYIRADGSVDPDTAPISSVDNITYTLTDNIVGDVPTDVSAIVVERDNIVIDGAGYTLQGTVLRFATIGIHLSGRNNVTIKNIEIKAFYDGIRLSQSSENTITRNNLTDNDSGIFLWNSSDNSILGNNIRSKYVGFMPVWYSGIVLFPFANNNIVSRNNITKTTIGIFLYSSLDNSISGNNLRNNYCGMDISSGSYDNTISGNNVVANDEYGILLYESKNNAILANNITNNEYGIFLRMKPSNNYFYHNNFMYNTYQAYIETSGYANFWDYGYPSGGNYWSNYNGIDLYSGPYQNETGSDGIGDSVYTIDVNNRDRYPLMNPWAPPGIPPVGIHDIAIVNISAPTHAYIGWIANITVTVRNNGDYPEVFSVIAYYNSTAIDTRMINNVYGLASGENIILTFNWNTENLAPGNYTLSVQASPVPAETNIADNTLTDGTVRVKMIGDINGDGIVNIQDIVIAALAFGSYPGHTRWDPRADLRQDGIINIIDLVIIGVNFGKKLPL